MSPALGLGGWLLALAGLGAAAGLRFRLVRHLTAVARACHELRGPLTAVRLGLELGPRPAHPLPERLRAIELQLGRAALALQDLSELGETGRRCGALVSRPEPVELCEVVGDSVEAWRPWAEARGARVRVDVSRAGLIATGERLRLAQAVGNLIANAVEHGGGTVVVKLGAERGRIRIEVTDDGPGLPATVDELARRRRRGEMSGRGHGLAIVRAIAAAHGGRLAAAPSDRGARLVLELPSASEAVIPGHAREPARR